MRKIKNLDLKSPKNKFLKFVYGLMVVYYQNIQVFCRRYDKIRESGIDKLIEHASGQLGDHDMKELLVFVGYPVFDDIRINLSEEALYLSLS